jgi:hypothetical protein
MALDFFVELRFLISPPKRKFHDAVLLPAGLRTPAMASEI